MLYNTALCSKLSSRLNEITGASNLTLRALECGYVQFCMLEPVS